MKMKEVERKLMNLPLGVYKLSEIIDIIIQCDQYQKEGLFNNSPYGRIVNKAFNDEFYKEILQAKHPVTGELIDIQDVYVDITYQRLLRLKKIIKHLKRKNSHGKRLYYSKMLAGSIDFAIRPDNRVFVWDGFRRAVLALLNGVRYVQASIDTEGLDNNLSDKQCNAREAEAFKIRNGDNENMSKAELYKAGLRFNDDKAM